MKLIQHTFLLFIVLAFSPLSGISQKYKELYCHARSGLSMRSVADLNAEKDTLVRYGESVFLIKTMDSTFMVNGLKGNWLKVKYADKLGYVFSAYLNEFPIKVKEGKHVYLKDYAFENLRKTDGDKNFEMTDYLEDSKEAIFGNNRYQCTAGGYCDLDERLYLENISVQDAMVMFTAYLMDYNDYKFKRKRFSYDKEFKEYQYSFIKKAKGEGFNQDYYMAYKLDSKGDYKRMTVGFDWEGGGGTVIISKWSETIVCIEHSYSCH